MKSLAETGSRLYRISETHRSNDVHALLQDILAAFQEVLGFLPLKTRSSNCLAFRMLSMTGAAAYKLLLKRHRYYPYKVFGLLGEPVGVESLS